VEAKDGGDGETGTGSPSDFPSPAKKQANDTTKNTTGSATATHSRMGTPRWFPPISLPLNLLSLLVGLSLTSP
jgi:hypothetical protein